MSSASREALLSVCPVPVAGLDWRSLALTPRDGYLLSRIDGATTPRLLADFCGLPVDDVLEGLGRLERLGAVRWSNGAAAGTDVRADEPAAAASATARRAAGAIPNASREDPPVDEEAVLAETCDLPLEERRLVFEVDRRLGSLTHWALLELHGAPSAAEVKRAYFAQSRRFHPDRWFGKELGSFKGRLERIFKALRAAYEVLSDDARRARYAAEHPAPASGATLEELVPRRPVPLSEAELEQQRQRILAARRKGGGGSPFSLEQAERLHAHGLELLAAGDAEAAAEELRRALSHAPGNARYRQDHEEARAAADAARLARLVADAEAARDRPLVAAELLARAFELAPAEVGHAIRAAELFLEGHEPERAWPIVQSALASSPRRRDVRLVAARVLEDRGDVRGALLQVETVASWDGTDPHLASLIERLSRR